MTASLLDRTASAPTVRRDVRALPGVVTHWLRDAGVAETPSSARELRFDGTARADVVKTVATFHTSADAIERMLASMPAAERPPPGRGRRGVASHRNDATTGPDGFRADEDFPWWNPDPAHRCRRLAWHTARFDFVEMIVDEDDHRVHLRTIA